MPSIANTASSPRLHPTGFPVAKPYVLCEDESVIGTMFYVMDCVEGRIYWGPLLPDSVRRSRAHGDL
jgi:aminoglycoside phosphotransferase (APT) family kinase protein